MAHTLIRKKAELMKIAGIITTHFDCAGTIDIDDVFVEVARAGSTKHKRPSDEIIGNVLFDMNSKTNRKAAVAIARRFEKYNFELLGPPLVDKDNKIIDITIVLK